MDRPGPSQPPLPLPPPPPSSTTENPIVAVGRKVKSVLTSRQEPSVRLLRGSSSRQEPASRVPLPQHNAEKLAPSQENASASRFGKVGSRFRSLFSRDETSANHESYEYEYDTDTVDLLDVVDPEVATLSTLTNVQNSLFVPSIGRLINRRPTYRVSEEADETRTIDKLKASLRRIANLKEEGDEKGDDATLRESQDKLTQARASTALQDAQYAVLPAGETLRNWTPEEKEELDDKVRHKLHSRRAKTKRALRGFMQYVRRPLGLFITVYATLITLFGAAWVLFLIGWISLGSKQDYVVNIVDNVLVALFAIIGDGLAPFRAVDTYHMIYIAYYHRKTWKKRAKLGLPDLVDHNDLPEQRKTDVQPVQVDLESLVARRMPRGLARRVAPRIPKRIARRIVSRGGIQDPSYEYSVLTEEQQAKLEFHERKFSKSHTFYKPHETETHFAFPLKLLVTVVLLLDCHSMLQISLGACTWGIPYRKRPFALTTVILCCSITCNIMGGVLISVGDKRTRKKDVIERMMRQELTAEAIEEMETRWYKEAEARGEVDKSVRKRHEEEKEEAENEEIKKSWKAVPALPKILLGKGEDHRQPSLPQGARRSNPNIAATPSSSTAALSPRGKDKNNSGLPPVQEDAAQPTKPKPVLKRGPEPPKEGTGQKVMKFIRRADLDRS